MFVVLIMLTVLFYVAGGDLEGKLQEVYSRNPEGNHLDAEDGAPLKNTEIAAQGTTEYMGRLLRGGDTLLPDGRMEHATYPAPDPSTSYRDLYS